MAAPDPRPWTDEERREVAMTLLHMSNLIRAQITGADERRIRYLNGLVVGHVSILSRFFPDGLAATIPPKIQNGGEQNRNLVPQQPDA